MPARRRCFQEVAASEGSFERYVCDLTAACVHKGVTFRFGPMSRDSGGCWQRLDRIVIATGAHYRYGLGPIAKCMLDWGAGRWPGLSQLFSHPAFRDWFYYQARQGTAERFKQLAKPGQAVTASAMPCWRARASRRSRARSRAALLG